MRDGLEGIDAFCITLGRALSVAFKSTSLKQTGKKRRFGAFRQSCVDRLTNGTDLTESEAGFWSADHNQLDPYTEEMIANRTRAHIHRLTLKSETRVLNKTQTLAGINVLSGDQAVIDGIRSVTLRRLYARTGGFKKSQASKERRLTRRQREKERESVSGF